MLGLWGVRAQGQRLQIQRKTAERYGGQRGLECIKPQKARAKEQRVDIKEEERPRAKGKDSGVNASCVESLDTPSGNARPKERVVHIFFKINIGDTTACNGPSMQKPFATKQEVEEEQRLETTVVMQPACSWSSLYT